MRKQSLFMLAGAVILALIAVFIARTALQPAPQRIVTAAAPETTPAVAARAPLAFGDKVTADKLKVVQLPPGTLPPGTYRTIPAALQGGQRVAQRAIGINEVIVPAAISGSGNRLSGAGVIGPAMRAVAVNVTEPSGVGDLIAPGDHVDIYITRTPPEHAARVDVSLSQNALDSIEAAKAAAPLPAIAGGPLAAAPSFGRVVGGPHAIAAPGSSTLGTRAVQVSGSGADKPQPITDLLVQDARVLAIGQNFNVGDPKATAPRTATLEVTPAQGAKLTLGQQVGTLTMALRALADQDRTALASLKVEDLHDGPPRMMAVAHAPRRAHMIAKAAAPSVEIVRGVISTAYAVPGA